MNDQNDMDMPIAILSILSFVGLVGIGSFFTGVFAPVRDWLLEWKIAVPSQESVIAVSQWGIGLDLPRLVLLAVIFLSAIALLISAGRKRHAPKNR